MDEFSHPVARGPGSYAPALSAKPAAVEQLPKLTAKVHKSHGLSSNLSSLFGSG